MKSLLKDLFFDKELVARIKEMKVDTDLLYIQLMTGKITLQEYMAAL
ncbi:MAG: hypothetical protein P4L51_08160 [Puia sp.]|nr:hypothetical protein [Puia sp.]